MNDDAKIISIEEFRKLKKLDPRRAKVEYDRLLEEYEKMKGVLTRIMNDMGRVGTAMKDISRQLETANVNIKEVVAKNCDLETLLAKMDETFRDDERWPTKNVQDLLGAR